MPEERFLTIQLHELLTYLGQQGVVDAAGRRPARADRDDQCRRPVDASYLADSVILLRYFEAAGRGEAGDLGRQEAAAAARRTIRELRLDGGASTSASP